MIVLTYIKLHQSATRDIVLLVNHAMWKQIKRETAVSLNSDLFYWQLTWGHVGGPLQSDVVWWEQTVEDQRVHWTQKGELTSGAEVPVKYTQRPRLLSCVQFLFAVQEIFFPPFKLKINYSPFDPHTWTISYSCTKHHLRTHFTWHTHVKKKNNFFLKCMQKLKTVHGLRLLDRQHFFPQTFIIFNCRKYFFSHKNINNGSKNQTWMKFSFRSVHF